VGKTARKETTPPMATIHLKECTFDKPLKLGRKAAELRRELHHQDDVLASTDAFVARAVKTRPEKKSRFPKWQFP
jgi:hypothetical protein